MRDHKKLRAFELADEVAILVYRVTAGFPKEELYGLSKRLGLLGKPDLSLIEQKIVETEKVLSSLIRSLRI